MGWTAGETKVTGNLIAAADWNKYLGATGSLDYLKTQTETNAADIVTAEGKHNDCSHLSPSRSSGTQYQNGSKIRIVEVTGSASTGGSGSIIAYIGSASANSTVGEDNLATNNGIFRCSVTFVVPANWYYKVLAEGAAGIHNNVFEEWDLL